MDNHQLWIVELTVENLKKAQRLYNEYYRLEALLEACLANEDPMDIQQWEAWHESIDGPMRLINKQVDQLELQINAYYSQGSGALQVLMSQGHCFDPYMDIIGGWGILDESVLKLTGWWGRPVQV